MSTEKNLNVLAGKEFRQHLWRMPIIVLKDYFSGAAAAP
jgi:hypothetical protein